MMPFEPHKRTDWLAYRGHEICLFHHRHTWAGVARFNGELVAYCEAGANDFTHQHLRKIIDERMQQGHELALDAVDKHDLATAMQRAIKHLDVPGRRLLHLHTSHHNAAIGLHMAQGLSGLHSSVEVILRYAQLGRLLYDHLGAHPPATSNGEEPYLRSVLCRKEPMHGDAVLSLVPAVYWALQASEQGPASSHGHRITQNLSGGKKHPPFR